MSKTNFSSVKIDDKEIRKVMNAKFAAELKEKGYECEFSEKTLKLKSIKPIKLNVKTDRLKAKFDKLQEDLRRRFNYRISFTESYTLRAFYPIDRDAIKENEDAEKNEQTEQQVA